MRPPQIQGGFMLKRLLVTLAVFLLVSVCTLGAGILAEPSTSVQIITEESACPAVGCASGECHGFDSAPMPDGSHEMICPEATCSSIECHAWDTLINRYHQASDASLNVWILAPVVLVAGLVLVTRKVG